MKPNCVLGLATGSTPVGTYRQLVEWYEKGDLDFSEVMTVNLDEYKGLTRENPQSYYYFMNENLFGKVNINKTRTFLPDGTEPDSKTACENYNEILRAVGDVDLQLLGLGHNGHIGFNEPGESFSTETHCIDLSEQTIKANARFFETVHHGRQDHHVRAPHPDHRVRRGQGRDRKARILRSHHTSGAGFHPAAPPQCDPGG